MDDDVRPLASVHGGSKRWIGKIQGLCPQLDGYDNAANYIFKKITAGKKPAIKKPHMIISIGPPGAGKSTITQELVKNWSEYNFDKYVEFDWDSILDFFKGANQIRNLPDMTGRPTNIGAAFGWFECLEKVDDPASIAYNRLMKEKYNIIVHVHDYLYLIDAQLENYICTLFYIAVTKETALRRASARALELGRFLPLATEKNGWGWEDIVNSSWDKYRRYTPWYALWADNLAIVNNDRDNHKFVKSDFKIYVTHPPFESEQNWFDMHIKTLYDAIEDAHNTTKK